MTARVALRVAAVLACAALLAAPARAEDPRVGDARSVERWTAAARSYPDDPDVAWAYALALSDAGRVDDALRQLRAVGARWPERAGCCRTSPIACSPRWTTWGGRGAGWRPASIGSVI